MLGSSQVDGGEEEEWVIALYQHPVTHHHQHHHHHDHLTTHNTQQEHHHPYSSTSNAANASHEDAKEEKDALYIVQTSDIASSSVVNVSSSTGTTSSSSSTSSTSSSSSSSSIFSTKSNKRGFLSRLVIPLSAFSFTNDQNSNILSPVSPSSARSSSTSNSSSRHDGSQYSPSPRPHHTHTVVPAAPSTPTDPVTMSDQPVGSSSSSCSNTSLLHFSADDIIHVVSKDSDNYWWYGSVLGKTNSDQQPVIGRFPAAFTHSIHTDNKKKTTTNSNNCNTLTLTTSLPRRQQEESSIEAVAELHSAADDDPSSSTSVVSSLVAGVGLASSDSSSNMMLFPVDNSSSSLSQSNSSLSVPVVDRSPKQQKLVDRLREKVSKKKRRYQRDGVDLDLSYITHNIIAMGFPSESLEGLYRNHMKDVKDFLTRRHGDKYKVYNLCSERSYPSDRFLHMARYPFDDHQPASMQMITEFCKDAHAWLTQSNEHVVVTHCKAGKGRTGFMIACYLLYSHLFDDAQRALRFYAYRRTKNAKGVTIPSQIRYTHYFDQLLKQQQQHQQIPSTLPFSSPHHVKLVLIRLHNCPTKLLQQGKEVYLNIKASNGTDFSSKHSVNTVVDREGTTITLRSADYPDSASQSFALCDQPIEGDVQCVCFTAGRFESVKLFQVWFNTRFLRLTQQQSTHSYTLATHTIIIPDSNHTRNNVEMHLTKPQLDKACKDVMHKTFPRDFSVELVFALAEEQEEQ